MIEQEPLSLSALQHYAFCPRQWALIDIERQWAENLRTVEGDVFHHRVHDEAQSELRGDTLILRGLRVRSQRLQVSGICDVVEFYREPEGIALSGREGLWRPYPVEYKKGAPKARQADELQLCAQALCLEEMLACVIPQGSLFYGETRRRVRVDFDPPLRETVAKMLGEMHRLMARGHTPAATPTKACNACSLREICLPRLRRAPKVSDYLRRHMEEDG